MADGCQPASAHSQAKAQAVRALIRPVGHLLPSFGREKAILFEIIAFSRALFGMGEGGRRPDEGLFIKRSNTTSHICASCGLP
jgi:hypothetical protein